MRSINIFRTMAVAGAVLLAPSMLSAQVANKPLSFAIFGGASVPTGDASDAFNTGYTLGGSMDLRNSSMLGLRAEASYSSMGFKEIVGTGKTTDMGANLNAVLWTSKRPGAISPYITGGATFGHYDFGAGTDAENHWGYNAGAGLDLNLGRIPARVDFRYQEVSMGNDVKMKTVPLTFGIRF
jgi:hypothetical protein